MVVIEEVVRLEEGVERTGGSSVVEGVMIRHEVRKSSQVFDCEDVQVWLSCLLYMPGVCL